MSDSITLRKLLGLSPAPAPLSESALIMVDCQNTYREGLMQLVGVEPALAQCATPVSYTHLTLPTSDLV